MTLLAALAAGAAHEHLHRNLNYRSPSKQVSGPGLSFEVDHVARRLDRRSRVDKGKTASKLDYWDAQYGTFRQSEYRGAVNWDHGVASGDPYSGM